MRLKLIYSSKEVLLLLQALLEMSGHIIFVVDLNYLLCFKNLNWFEGRTSSFVVRLDFEVEPEENFANFETNSELMD